MSPRTVPVAQAVREGGVRARRLEESGEPILRRQAVLGMNERECVAPDRLSGVVAENMCGGCAAIDNFALPVEERDRIRNMLDERAKPPLARTKDCFRCRFGDQSIFQTSAPRNKLKRKYRLLYTKR